MLNITATAGHEDRIEPITRRALEFVADRLPMSFDGVTNVAHLVIPPVALPLAALSDDEAATRIADALVEALTLKLNAS